MKAKVRGIYATALTRLLLENGFQIVQSSQAIKTRFNIPENNAPPDIKIKDRYDLQGIVALGTAEAVNVFQRIIHASLEDAVTRKWDASVDGIYKGKIVGENDEAVHVQIGNDLVGVLLKQEIQKGSQDELIVQVERLRIGRKNPALTTQIKIVGEYAILTRNGRVGVSLKIRDLNVRAQLYALGKSLAPNGWGIIWREPAANKPKETLENEIVKLAEKVDSLDDKAASASAPALLVEGLHFMNVEFPHASKNGLDMLRASVTPTINGHHFYKSCGGKVSAALEMAEKLLEKGQSRDEVEELFKTQIRYEFPEEGSTVDVEHVKLGGAVFHLGQATIEALNNGEIKYTREIKADGFYDGLGTAKEAGDKAVSETRLGEWQITTKYFSKNGEWKGTYVNLNTPVELYPQSLRYVDLEIDICVNSKGEVKVLDVEKLEKALTKGVISGKLFEKIKAEADKILNRLPTA